MTDTAPQTHLFERRREVILAGSLFTGLWQMSGALALGLLMIHGLSLVDTYFVSRLGLAHLAALGYAFPILFVYNAILLALSVGASTRIARKIGAGEDQGLPREVFQCLFLSMSITLIFWALGYGFMPRWVSLMGASGEAQKLACDYLEIALVGMLFLVVPTTGGGILRGSGNIRFLTLLMLGLCAANLLLSCILILGWGSWSGWGIRGAAWAALIPRIIATFITIIVLARSEKMLRWRDLSFRGAPHTWLKVLRVATPSALGNMIRPAVLGVITVHLSYFGDRVVGGYTLASRIESLIYVIFISLAGALSTYVGQNYGAGDEQRVRRCFSLSLLMVLICGGFASILCLILLQPLLSLFPASHRVLSYAHVYLGLVVVSYCAEGMRIVISGGFYAMDRALLGLLVGLWKVLVICGGCWVAVMMLGSWWWVFWSVSLANLTGGVMALWLLMYVTHKQLGGRGASAVCTSPADSVP